MIAFVLLSMVSPVTYSVASLIKRVFVITVAIVWFGSHTTPIQAAGIVLTFIGLYLYDRTSDAAKADRKARLDQLRSEGTLLPLNTSQHRPSSSAAIYETPTSIIPGQLFGSSSNYQVNGEEKKTDSVRQGRPRVSSRADAWLPAGIRQEESWRHRDLGTVT